MSDKFLSRWSRRKQAARPAEGELATCSDDAAPRAPGVAQQHAGDSQAPATEAAITPEEIAALPKVDELAADSDILGFLRRGVPDDLRNAALRRIWMLDPSIRDFVGHARDYSYDWNTPGGVPGNGMLPPGSEVTAMLRQVFGESDSDASTSEMPGQRISQNRHLQSIPLVDDAPSAAMKDDGARGMQSRFWRQRDGSRATAQLGQNDSDQTFRRGAIDSQHLAYYEIAP